MHQQLPKSSDPHTEREPHPYAVTSRQSDVHLLIAVSRYLSGNFAPVHQTWTLTPCSYVGQIPPDLAGGQYVRNGANPVANEDAGRDAHWFDGDGMLSGVSFRKLDDSTIQPEFANQYILTDVFLASKSSPYLKTPILPSIATLINPVTTLLWLLARIFRAFLLVLLSHLPGSRQCIRKISVANASLLYHDGRALATCESGPPMRVALPGLETIGWYNGHQSENEKPSSDLAGFGGTGALSFWKEWTTAHPRVDPESNELLLYHSTFLPPYLYYSVVGPSSLPNEKSSPLYSTTMLNRPVPGMKSPKLIHDFGATKTHTIMLDLPLELDPLNILKNRPSMTYDPTSPSRFGIFPRYQPERTVWLETNSCCIFHVANAWDSPPRGLRQPSPLPVDVNLLACRLTSASIVYSAGAVAAPIPTAPVPAHQFEEEQCRLYYYQFHINEQDQKSRIKHQWALSAIPFEFPSVNDASAMRSAKYIYGCSCLESNFGAALGRGTKIDALAKIDAEQLIARGIQKTPEQVRGCVDTRNIHEIMASQDPNDPIRVFRLPDGFFAQEPRFVPRKGSIREDDGWILTYVFDEAQLDRSGNCKPNARSELWIIEAWNMQHVAARVLLPARVPYGLHGQWFSEKQVMEQRPFESIRSIPFKSKSMPGGSLVWKAWMSVRDGFEAWLQ